MDVLNEMKGEDLAIFRAYSRRVLQEHADKMDELQREEFSMFESDFWNRRAVISDDKSLIYKHLPQHRFIDMKTRVVGDRKISKRHYDVHNRIIMGHYNGIQMDLTYGLTEQIKEDLRKKFNGINF